MSVAMATATAEELLAMGDIGRCELIKGELIHMSPSGARHGRIAGKICFLLIQHVEARSLGMVCGAETGFLATRDPDTVRGPDAMFVSRERMPPEESLDSYLPIPPDLAVEVVSPDDRWSEVEGKVSEYLDAGVRLVWVVDPKTRCVHVHRPHGPVDVLSSADDLSGGDVLPDFSCKVEELFA